MATLSNFNTFHSMRADPFTANKCIKSFTTNKGCILFMPSSYSQTDNQTKSGSARTSTCSSRSILEEINLHDASNSLNLISYYALVIASFTGMSTILGLTQSIKVVEFANDQAPTVWPLAACDDSNNATDRVLLLRSDLEPKIEVKNEIFEYIEMHLGHSNKRNGTIKLKRKFEYCFRLVGLNVIMLHFTSTRSHKKSIRVPDAHVNEETMHLVEVYHIQNPLLRILMAHMFRILGRLSKFLFDKKNLKDE